MVCYCFFILRSYILIARATFPLMQPRLFLACRGSSLQAHINDLSNYSFKSSAVPHHLSSVVILAHVVMHDTSSILEQTLFLIPLLPNNCFFKLSNSLPHARAHFWIISLPQSARAVWTDEMRGLRVEESVWLWAGYVVLSVSVGFGLGGGLSGLRR